MHKKLLLICALSSCFFLNGYAQDFFSNIIYSGNVKGVGANRVFGWGENLDGTIDPRPNFNTTYGTMMINYHTGLTLSAHSVYGGIRFYNQGYPNPYDAATGSVMAMSIIDGNVGVGTTTPKASFDVGRLLSPGALGSVLARLPEGNSTGAGTYLGIKGYDTSLSAANNFNDTKSFAIEHSFYGVTNSSINFFRGGDIMGGCISFNTNDNTEKMRILNNGNVGIGIIAPAEKLAVNGTVHAKEVKIDMSGWPDYVFKDDYVLTPLKELSIYINQNHHLPDMPSEGQVEKEGVRLGEMNKLLTKKVEELTLYLIEKDKQLQEQSESLNELRNYVMKSNSRLSHQVRRLDKSIHKNNSNNK